MKIGHAKDFWSGIMFIAIGAMFGLSDQMLSGMNEAHQSVNPSHLNIILRQFIEAFGKSVLPDVARVECEPRELEVRRVGCPAGDGDGLRCGGDPDPAHAESVPPIGAGIAPTVTVIVAKHPGLTV